MSETETARTRGPAVSSAQCAAWRRAVHDDATTHELARESHHAQSTVSNHVRGGKGCSHDAVEPVRGLRTPIHESDDHVTGQVRDALRARLDANLGGTCYFDAGQLKRDHEISVVVQKVASAVGALAEDDGELVVERVNPRANQARWLARREGGDSE